MSREDRLDLARGPVTVRRAGTGPPLLLLHSGASDSSEWSAQLERFADAFTVLAPDAPGCGGSFDPPEGFGMDGYADTVAELVHALALGERPHVVGLSFGGGLALATVERHPDLARSLVLVSAYAGWKGSLPPAEVAARTSAALAELERSPVADVRASGIRPMIAAFAEADLRAGLSEIRVPTLVVHGDADVRAPRSVADALHAAIPGSRLEVVPGVGHLVPFEAPDHFDALLRAFVREVGA